MLRFAYKIARGNARWRSGHHALEDLTHQELTYWRASYKLDPFGDDWERSSMIAAVVINGMRAMAPGAAELMPEDLLPLDSFVPYRHQHDEADELRESAEAFESLRI